MRHNWCPSRDSQSQKVSEKLHGYFRVCGKTNNKGWSNWGWIDHQWGRFWYGCLSPCDSRCVSPCLSGSCMLPVMAGKAYNQGWAIWYYSILWKNLRMGILSLLLWGDMPSWWMESMTTVRGCLSNGKWTRECMQCLKVAHRGQDHKQTVMWTLGQTAEARLSSQRDLAHIRE